MAVHCVGRIDRKIEFPLPNEKTKRRIFAIHTGRMTLADDVDLESFVMSKDDLSGADIKAICTEAGLMALRERRMKVTGEDFQKSKENVLYRKTDGTPEGKPLESICGRCRCCGWGGRGYLTDGTSGLVLCAGLYL